MKGKLKMFLTPSQICILGLIFIATMVSIFQIGQKPKQAWPWIVGYWVLLTIKNVFDYLATIYHG